MNPDEEHQKYFNNNPMGNHDEPSRKTLELVHDLELKINDVEKEIMFKIDDHAKEDNTRFKMIEKGKVDWEKFYWVISILMSIVLGVFGLIYQKLEKVDEKTTSTQTGVARIEGQLNNAEITN